MDKVPVRRARRVASGAALTAAGPDYRPALLLGSVFVIATCGLIYELIAGTLASYLLGDSVMQFSTIIGAYLFSMGIGSWLSRYLGGSLLRWFIRLEILVGLVGGFSAPLLFVLFEYVSSFRLMLYALVGLTGVLVGLEIPLLMRILENRFEFKDLVSRVFTFDYIGALLASLVFPLVLVPQLGLIRTSLLCGALNVVVAGVALYRFPETRPFRRSLTGALVASLVALAVGFGYAERLQTYTEGLAFQDQVIYSKTTPYQRLVLTKNQRELRLFLNGNLQFSSADEYRYHEALVHPAMQALPQARRVLVLGGGDGAGRARAAQVSTAGKHPPRGPRRGHDPPVSAQPDAAGAQPPRPAPPQSAGHQRRRLPVGAPGYHPLRLHCGGLPRPRQLLHR